MAPRAGDRVRVMTREATAEDTKSGLYYSFFGGLAGSVDRVYDDGTVCVDVDLDSLTEDIRRRHLGVQEAERKRWLEGLSDEMRNRLTAEQKQLKMNYRILVTAKDIEVVKGGKPSGSRASADTKADDTDAKEKKAAPRAPTPHERPADQAAPEPPEPPEPESKAIDDEPAPKRLSEADIAAAEEAFLRSRQSSL